MSGLSACAAPDFASLALRGLVRLEPGAAGREDLLLELGLSFWIASSGSSLDDAGSALMVVREALVSAAGLEIDTEPIPLRGIDPRLDILNLAAYLRGLIGRAVAHARFNPTAIVERALERLADRSRSARPALARA
jgi:hypothetical protein